MRYLKLYNPPGPWVVLLGLDGSGKSTVLKILGEEFTSPFFVGLKIIYQRPNLRGDTQQNSGPVIDHYGKPPHGVIKSVVKLGIRAGDWWLGYWSRLAFERARGYLVLMDRHYFLDIAVDPLRYRYSGPSWLAHRFGLLLPKPDMFIMLDAPIDVLQSRKQEVTPEQAARQREAYLKLMQNLANSYIVDASAPLDQVITNIKQIIMNYLSQREQTAKSAIPS